MNSADKRLVTCVRVLTGLFVGAFAGFTAGTLLAIIVAEELEFPWLRQLIYGFHGALIGGWIGILVGWGRLQLRVVATPWGQKEPGPAPPSRRARQSEPVEVEPQEDRGHDTRHGGEAGQSEPVKGAVRPVLTGLFAGAFAGFTAGVLLAIIVAQEQLFYGFHGALIGGWIGILVGWWRPELRAVATPWGQKEPGPAPPSRRARQPEPVEVEPQEDRGHDTRPGGEARQSEPLESVKGSSGLGDNARNAARGFRQ